MVHRVQQQHLPVRHRIGAGGQVREIAERVDRVMGPPDDELGIRHRVHIAGKPGDMFQEKGTFRGMEDGKVDRLMDVHEIPIPQFLVRRKQVDADRRRRAVVVVDERTEEEGKALEK